MDFIKDKIEEKTGSDLNRDGRIGSGGLTGAAEKATHMDFNHDGVIGGKPASAGGGLIGKAEQATHIDFNNDGRIGSGAHKK